MPTSDSGLGGTGIGFRDGISPRSWEKSLKFGFETISFRGLDITWDSHCPRDHMYILSEKDMYWGVTRDLGFMNYDGQQWVRAADHTDAINAMLVWRGQLCCSNPKAQTRIYNLPLGTSMQE
jgi:hypothetical protein